MSVTDLFEIVVPVVALAGLVAAVWDAPAALRLYDKIGDGLDLAARKEASR